MPTIDLTTFNIALSEFRRIHRLIAGEDFSGWSTGFVHHREGYKTPLRQEALRRLSLQDWTEDAIGSGTLLRRTIRSIEIDASAGVEANNLLIWEVGIHGRSGCEHVGLLDCLERADGVGTIEAVLFRMLKRQDVEGAFDPLIEIVGKRYPVMAFLSYLVDDTRYMPIKPKRFDELFAFLGVDLRTAHQCSFENYRAFNGVIAQVREHLGQVPELSDARLINAHSFLWMLDWFRRLEASGQIGKQRAKEQKRRKALAERPVRGGVALSVERMIHSIEGAVAQSGRTTAGREAKDKRLTLSRVALRQHLVDLVAAQADRCQLTELPFCHSADGDLQMRPSADRIDSKGDYAVCNIEVVCQFVNFWKGTTDNDEFKQLLNVVRGA
ncbi:MAG: hypothetical protein AAF318_06675 [Pseudomonadota bacterium]